MIVVSILIFNQVLNNSDGGKASSMKLLAKPLGDFQIAKDDAANFYNDADCLRDKRKCPKTLNNSAVVFQSHNQLFLNEDGAANPQNALGNRFVKPGKQDYFVLKEDVVKPDSDSYENMNNVVHGDKKDTNYEAQLANAKNIISLNSVGREGDINGIYDVANLPRGVPVVMAKQYMNTTGVFMCIDTKREIIFSRVNDDYCDCSDSSDEPGTNACPDSRFEHIRV